MSVIEKIFEPLTLLPKAWYLGNTTVRSPYRIKGALKILSQSALVGNLMGSENESAFAKLLHDSEIVTISRLIDDPTADVTDLGRKWRAALQQLGFLNIFRYRQVPHIHISRESNTITENGNRLIRAESLQAEQECFLRALMAQQLPSSIERFAMNVEVFNPLRVVLSILNSLESKGLVPVIKKNEMASIVQLTGNINSIDRVVDAIRAYRDIEATLSGRERKEFQNNILEAAANKVKTQSAETLVGYADSNFRYLKITGLFSECGHGICIADHKKTLVKQILAVPFQILPGEEYLANIGQGAKIPSDNESNAVIEIIELDDLLRANNEIVQLPALAGLSIQDLSQIRMDLEERWRQLQELNYAKKQAMQWENIVNYLRAFGKKNSSLIPRGEAPAYLEWTLWRAFLAINSLCNKPWESRRFRVDQDFIPISTAAGNGPDMIFEFDDFVIVVEVTLTTSSRQEAAEGEPVRRHVASYVDSYGARGKSVYGLFIANTIDTNTAETFRIGVWYRKDDSKLVLRIVPITIEQFCDLFEASFNHSVGLEANKLIQLLGQCRVDCNMDAPDWKMSIAQEMNRAVTALK